MFGRCKHEKLTEVKDCGFQYCEACGKAFRPPRASLGAELTHELEDVPNSDSTIQKSTISGPVKQGLRQQKCRNCGKYFTYNLTAGVYEWMPDNVDCIKNGQQPVKP
jgi:uncharacterized OB-fold protein